MLAITRRSCVESMLAATASVSFGPAALAQNAVDASVARADTLIATDKPSGGARTFTQYNDFNIPILYLTHNRTTAYHVANAIIVLYRGTIVETGDAETVIQHPQHPYTQILLDSIPWPDLDTPWSNCRPLADGFAAPAPISAVGFPSVARCCTPCHAVPHGCRRSTRPTHAERCTAFCTRTRRASREQD